EQTAPHDRTEVSVPRPAEWAEARQPPPGAAIAEPVALPAEPPPAAPAKPAELPPAVAASNDHLATLHAIGQRISASLDLAETLEVVVDSVVEVTHGERGFIMLWDEASGRLTYSIGRNVDGADGKVPELSQHVVQSVFRDGQPICVGDALTDARFNQYESVLMQNLRSILC